MLEKFSSDHFPVGCLVSSSRRQILYANDYFNRHYGYSAGSLVDSDLFTLLSKASQIIHDSYLMPLLVREGRCEEIRLSLMTRKGKSVPVMVSARLDQNNEGCIFWSIANAVRSEEMFEELGQARELLQQKISLLHSLAETDELTGLPNRVALTRHLNQQIKDAEASGNVVFALAFLDLDGFKDINDRYGHQVGDKLLRLVAKRMTGNLRTEDVVARFGGDEFVIILQGDFGAGLAEESLARLIRQLSEPFYVDSISLQISASAGVTLYPQAEKIASDQLVRQADQAMYQAKVSGRNQLCYFNVDNERNLKNKHEEAAAIKAAIAADQFELYYQPKVNMRTGEVLGAEALLRWNHPEQGLLSPLSFLPAVSETRTGLDLGRWVIASALAQLQSWHDQGLEFNVSINIAGYHLQHPNFLSDLRVMLAKHPNLQKQQLEIEVLETSAIEDIDHISAVLTSCKMLGIRVSLDDFGTGYSTLGHLKDLSVDMLKIDRSFVSDMLTNEGDLTILKGVISFAQAFQCDVIAEGVETSQQGRRLIELGCEWGQGYYIARPMPASSMQQWVSDWREQQHAEKFESGGL